MFHHVHQTVNQNVITSCFCRASHSVLPCVCFPCSTPRRPCTTSSASTGSSSTGTTPSSRCCRVTRKVRRSKRVAQYCSVGSVTFPFCLYRLWDEFSDLRVRRQPILFLQSILRPLLLLRPLCLFYSSCVRREREPASEI